MRLIISQNKLKQGKYDTLSAFAKSVGQVSQNMHKLMKGQTVSTNVMESTCRVHRVNPTWLLLGEGEMFMKDDINERVAQLEARVKKLESVGRNR